MSNPVTFRLALNYDEAIVLEKVLAGTMPTILPELDLLGDIEERLTKNLDRYRAGELLRKSREERILEDLVNLRDIRPPDTSKQEAEALETLKQMAISKGEYNPESDELDRNELADVE